MHLPPSIDYGTVMVFVTICTYDGAMMLSVIACEDFIMDHLVFRFLLNSVPSTLWWGIIFLDDWTYGS